MIIIPEQFKTVTRFSKIVALILFISLPFLGAIVGFNYQKAISDIKIQELENALSPTVNVAKQNATALEKAKPPEELSEYTDKSGCWENDNWRDIGGCSKLRGEIINSLATIEDARNKIHLTQDVTQSTYLKKYISAKYNFSISYPSTWEIEEYIYEGVDTVSFRDLEKAGEKVEIIIGTGMAYSTSGALCANQGCDYDGGSVTLANGTKIVLTKSYLFIPANPDGKMPTDTKVENYRFSRYMSYFLSEYPDDNGIYVTASFPDEESGKLILDILSTIKYIEQP